jgi:hypothetical protein
MVLPLMNVNSCKIGSRPTDSMKYFGGPFFLQQVDPTLESPLFKLLKIN